MKTILAMVIALVLAVLLYSECFSAPQRSQEFYRTLKQLDTTYLKPNGLTINQMVRQRPDDLAILIGATLNSRRKSLSENSSFRLVAEFNSYLSTIPSKFPLPAYMNAGRNGNYKAMIKQKYGKPNVPQRSLFDPAKEPKQLQYVSPQGGSLFKKPSNYRQPGSVKRYSPQQRARRASNTGHGKLLQKEPDSITLMGERADAVRSPGK